MKCYSRGSLKLDIQEKDKQNIKDVASNLKQQLKEQKVKLTIDAVALLGAFLTECGKL